MRPAFRGMTIVEVVVAVAIFAFAAVMTLQVVLATSQHFDAEVKQSDLQKRTSGRIYAMMADLSGASPTRDAQFSISNEGPTGVAPGYPLALVSGTGDGAPVSVPTTGGTVGDCITFRPAIGTNAGGVVWGNPIRYRWAPLVRAGLQVPNMGMLVKETLDPNGAIVLTTEVLEENVPVCDYQYDPTATPPKYPSGFAIIQAATETTPAGAPQLVARRRCLTISLQRCTDLRTIVTAGNGNSVATSTSIETVFFQNP